MGRLQRIFGLSLCMLMMFATGCRMIDSFSSNNGSTGGLASRNGAKTGETGSWLLPKDNWTNTKTPDPKTWTHPNDPAFDYKTEASGLLSGYVVNEQGRKMNNIYVKIRPATAGRKSDQVMGQETDQSGYFEIRGLEPGKTYILTAQAETEGIKMAGQEYVKVPSVHVRLTLLEGLQIETGESQNQGPTKKKDLPQFAPLQPAENTDRLQTPSMLPAPEMPSDLPGSSRHVPTRPDLTTNIPGLPVSRKVDVKSENLIELIDSEGRRRTLPSGFAGKYYLLDFMTTQCVPCKKALPYIKAVQAKYAARGLEVLGITCENESIQHRLVVAEKYRSDHQLNYLIYTEPASKPGPLLDRFKIEGYPTLVLIGDDGTLLWQGHPKELQKLELILQRVLP